MRILKYIAVGLGALVLLLAGGVGGFVLMYPASRPPPTEKVESTPARVARGQYLFEHVAACISCHAERDFTAYAAPVKAGTVGAGICFPRELKLPGEVCPRNLTPDPKAGIGAWSDGELMRAIREGIGRDGRALFPMMPYASYRHTSDEDTRAVVAYLRSLAPLPTEVPPTRLELLVSLATRRSPRPLDGRPVEGPPASDPVARGRYLASIAGCVECHTRKGQELAGGARFPGLAGPEISANLTPDPETGMGRVTREEFIGKFKAFEHMAPSPRPGRVVMPWLAFAGMTEGDLGDLYEYLMTVKPVKKAVPRSPGI